MRPSTIQFLRRVRQQVVLAIIFSLSLVGAALAQTVQISASPTGSSIAEQLGAEFVNHYPQHRVKQLPIGGNGSIRALRDGVLDVAIVSRPLRSYEVAGKTGTSIKVASSPIAFVSHRETEAIRLTTSYLADVYAREIQHWPSGARIRLIVSRGRTDTEVLKGISSEMESALNIALNRPGMSIAKNTKDVADRIEGIENAFGALALYAVESKPRQLNLHSVDGVMPSVQNLKNGTYPFSKPLYALVREDAHAGVRHFLKFMRSPKGQEILERNGYLPEPSGRR